MKVDALYAHCDTIVPVPLRKQPVDIPLKVKAIVNYDDEQVSSFRLCGCVDVLLNSRITESVQEYLLASIAHRPFFWATFTDSGTALHTLYSASVEILSIQRCRVMARSCLRRQTSSFSEQPLELLSCYCSTASVTRRLHCTSLVVRIQVPGSFLGPYLHLSSGV